MAEILTKVGDGAHYKDGDVLAAFNSRRIRDAHADRICIADARRKRKTRSGLIPTNDVARDWCEAVCEVRVDRLSKNEAQVVRLSDGDTIRFRSNETFTDHRGKAVQMDVEQYVAKRKRGGQKLLFGSTGREAWYGGREDRSDSRLGTVWAAIESKLGLPESDYGLWPMGRLDVHHHLAVRTEDFTDQEAANLVAPQYERDNNGEIVTDENGTPIIKAKRNYKTDWRQWVSELGASEADVLNPSKMIGRERRLPDGMTNIESKDQPQQSNRERLYDKMAGGPLSQ